MMAPEDKQRWIDLGRMLQARGVRYLNNHEPKSALEAAKILEIGTRIEREVVGCRDPRGWNDQYLSDTLDWGALNDAIDHHDGGKPIPLPCDVAERLKGRGFDLTGIPIEGQVDEPS